MARVNPEKIIDHLGHEMRRALEKALRDTIPDAKFDAQTVFQAFKREVGKACAMYEQVPDSCIQN